MRPPVRHLVERHSRRLVRPAVRQPQSVPVPFLKAGHPTWGTIDIEFDNFYYSSPWGDDDFNRGDGAPRDYPDHPWKAATGPTIVSNKLRIPDADGNDDMILWGGTAPGRPCWMGVDLAFSNSTPDSGTLEMINWSIGLWDERTETIVAEARVRHSTDLGEAMWLHVESYAQTNVVGPYWVDLADLAGEKLALSIISGQAEASFMGRFVAVP